MTINELVGIPWIKGGYKRSGVDCWGLIILALDELYGIKISAHKGSKACGDEMSRLASLEACKSEWKLVENLTYKPGDVILMYRKRPTHVGLYVGGGRVLHSLGGGFAKVSSIQQVDDMKIAFRKLEFYRWRSQ